MPLTSLRCWCQAGKGSECEEEDFNLSSGFYRKPVQRLKTEKCVLLHELLSVFVQQRSGSAVFT